jgi:hypothetical protein
MYDVHVKDVVRELERNGNAPSWATRWPFTGFIRSESIVSWRPRMLRDVEGNAETIKFWPKAVVEGGAKVSCSGEATLVLVRDFNEVTGWRLVTADASDDPVGADSRGNKRKPWGLKITAPRQLSLGL